MTLLRRLRVRWREAAIRQAIAELEGDVRRGERAELLLPVLRHRLAGSPEVEGLCLCLHAWLDHAGKGPCAVRPCGCEEFEALDG